MRSLITVRVMFLYVFAAGIAVGALLALVFFILPYQTSLAAPPTPIATPTLPSDVVFSQVDALDQILTTLYERVSPSVVHITSRTQTTDFFYGVIPNEGTGSGFILDREGHILTNNHVVAGADEVDVLLSNGMNYAASVIGTDAYYDLAVLKIDTPADTITPLELGDSSKLKVGQTVIAIGNPFGLDRTLTSGLISALGRRVETGSGGIIGQAIQTDAAINPGNSGGPLLDTRGRVVGINTAINSPSGGSVGIGFAVPIDVVKRVVPSLISTGHFAHPNIGVITAELGTEVSPGTDGPRKGLLITQLDTGGPGEAAGLQATTITRRGRRYVFSGGDIITAVNGRPIATKNDLLLAVEESGKPGDSVTLTVYRDGKSITVQVTLGSQ